MKFFNTETEYTGHPLVASVEKFLRRAGVSSVTVALSGGADSTALLRACAAIPSLRVDAAHCNFHLRGEESDRDQAFCESLCTSLGIRLQKIDFDVAEYRASRPGTSVEMACRELRYEWFGSILDGKHDPSARIAVAHNADDNAETLFLNLLRGSGVRGLKGMAADNGRIIRPLLTIPRSAILSFLADIRQSHITDSSNLCSDYRRNFLRNDIFPMLRSRWEGFDKTIARSIETLGRESAIIDHIVEDALSKTVAGGDAVILPWSVLDSFPDPVTLIYRWGAPAGISTEIAVEIAEAAISRRRPGAAWRFAGTELRMERDGLHMGRRAESQDDGDLSSLFVCERHDMTPELFSAIKSDRSNSCVWLPRPLECYSLRHPVAGDRIEPLGMKGSSLISDIMKDARLSRTRRLSTALLCDSAGRIIWAERLKRSRHELLTPASPSAYRIFRRESDFFCNPDFFC